MGAFKNEIIASQVEEADREFAPVPATRHVSLQYRNRRIVGPVVMSRRSYRTIVVTAITLSTAVGVLIGVMF